MAEALVAFARDPSDETFAAARLHDPTTLSVLRGEGDDVVDLIESFVDLSPAELRRPASWALSVDGRSISAVALIAATDGVSYVRTDTALEGCGFPGLADPGPHSVAIVPTMPGPCAERFAIVLNGDSGSISEVNVVLPTA